MLLKKAYTVTASQLINESFAVLSGVKPGKMGLGHALRLIRNAWKTALVMS